MREQVEYIPVWTGAMERAWIQSQQRQPEPPSLTARRVASMGPVSKAVASFLMSAGSTWHTVPQITEAVGMSREQVMASLNYLGKRQFIERKLSVDRDRMRQMQSYRWSAA